MTVVVRKEELVLLCEVQKIAKWQLSDEGTALLSQIIKNHTKSA